MGTYISMEKGEFVSDRKGKEQQMSFCKYILNIKVEL